MKRFLHEIQQGPAEFTNEGFVIQNNILLKEGRPRHTVGLEPHRTHTLKAIPSVAHILQVPHRFKRP